MIVVRVLLLVALAFVAGALAMYVIKRDRRYLRFIRQVATYTVALLLAVFVYYAVRRLFAYI